ncbi:MAG: hypothetical protein PW734_06580 [Verrucomicrobium sp.]|nr:hypothetical protein [Verrucomicrobium sp.]
MHFPRLVVAAFLLLLSAWPAQAKVPTWKCTLSGGNYEVALPYITSVSTQQYIVDGGGHITELTIDTLGNTQARFYCMQTGAQAAAAAGAGGAAQSLLEEAQQRVQDATDHVTSVMGGPPAAQTANTTVMKTYPTTTHAHTVEYRLETPAEVDALFQSVKNAWENGTTTTYTPTTTGGAATGQ